MLHWLSPQCLSRPRRGLFRLRSELLLPHARDAVFPFFADARNLDRITPPFLSFRVLTREGLEMRNGATIDYALRVHGMPLRWTSRIASWEPPARFVDMQVRGPYRWWYHEHLFEDLGDTTRVIDEVEYACPGGRLTHALFVKRDLDRIFGFRRERLAALFRDGRPI